MLMKKRRIDPGIRRRLDELGEVIVRAKLPWITNVTSLSDQDRLEDLGENVKAPVWAIARWLNEKETSRQRWVKAAAILAGLAVIVALLAWFFPRTEDEPHFASVAPSINPQPAPGMPKLSLAFTNTGRRPARQAAAALFAASEAHTRGQQLGETAPILANDGFAGQPVDVVLPTSTGYANFRFDNYAGNLFLACVTYFDGSKQLQQAFLYRLGKPETSLDEIEQPNYADVCR